MLNDMVREISFMLGDWPIGTFVGLLLLAAIAIFVGLVLWGLGLAIDSWFLPRQRGKGRVTGKDFTPAHTSTIMIYNVATKTSMPHIVHHPDDWSVTADVEGLNDSISVTQEFYDSVQPNDWVTVDFVRGRFSGGLYLKEMSA